MVIASGFEPPTLSTNQNHVGLQNDEFWAEFVEFARNSNRRQKG